MKTPTKSENTSSYYDLKPLDCSDDDDDDGDDDDGSVNGRGGGTASSSCCTLWQKRVQAGIHC